MGTVMRTMEEITVFLEGKLNELIYMRRTVHSGKFRIILANSTEDSKRLLENILKELDFRRLNKWIESSFEEELGNTGIRKLRAMAQELGVYRYSKLPKSVLLMEIRRMQNGGGSPTSHPNDAQ